MSKIMTVIMPFLNEADNEPFNTISSLCSTADPSKFDIIVINDCSESKYQIDFRSFSNVTYIKNQQRMGVDWCRTLGGSLATTENILIIDSHMRFKQDDWLNKMTSCCYNFPNDVFCTVSLGLGYGNMNIEKHAGKYWGADIMFFDKNADPKRFSRECLEPKWRNKEEKGEIYEIPCVLGAVYFMKKNRFDFLHGLKGLKMWGSSEVFLSLKNFMAGGTSRIHTGIEVGHRYRDNSPFVTLISWLYYNKIYICNTILPEDIGGRIIGCLPKDINLKNAMAEINKGREEIAKERLYYQSIFKNSIYDFCKRFNVSIF